MYKIKCVVCSVVCLVYTVQFSAVMRRILHQERMGIFPPTGLRLTPRSWLSTAPPLVSSAPLLGVCTCPQGLRENTVVGKVILIVTDRRTGDLAQWWGHNAEPGMIHPTILRVTSELRGLAGDVVTATEKWQDDFISPPPPPSACLLVYIWWVKTAQLPRCIIISPA